MEGRDRMIVQRMTASPAISHWLSKYHTLGSLNVWKCLRSKKSPLCRCFLAKLFQTTMKCRNLVHSNLRNRSNFMTPFAFSVSFPCHELFNKWQVLNRPLRRAHEHNRITCLATLSLKASHVSFASFIFHRFNGRSNRKLYQFVQNDWWCSDVSICYSLCIDFHQQEKVFKSV